MLHPRVRAGAARRRAVEELLARHDGRSRRPFASAAPGTVPELISQTKRITNRGQILSATLAHPAENHADAVPGVHAPPQHFVSKWLMPPMLRRFVTGSSAPVARAPTPTIRPIAGVAAALDVPIGDFVS